MELKKDYWTQTDAEEYHAYLRSLERPAKHDWTRRIINTSMPLLAIATPDLRRIAKGIARGNYMSFLDLALNDYYEDTCIRGTLISMIRDFDTMRAYLLPFAEVADNWATCDLLTFDISAQNAPQWWALSGDMIQSEKLFVRRIGVDIMFKFILPAYGEDYLPRVFERIATMREETEYYVNMAIAWLLAECFTKRRDDTLAFFEQDTLNAFVANRAVQKCRDSYRISQEDKAYLLRFKK